jgi:hypothetical protein
LILYNIIYFKLTFPLLQFIEQLIEKEISETESPPGEIVSSRHGSRNDPPLQGELLTPGLHDQAAQLPDESLPVHALVFAPTEQNQINNRSSESEVTKEKEKP